MGPGVDVQNLASAVPALSIAETKEQNINYMDQEMKNIAAAFISAKLNAVKGKQDTLVKNSQPLRASVCNI